MSNWHNYSLDQVGTIVSGSTPSTENPAFWNGNINWVTPNDLSKQKTRFIYDSDRKLSLSGFKSCSLTMAPALKSLIISSRAPVGYLAIPQINSATNQGCKTIIFKESHYAEFYYYVLLYNVNKIRQRAEGTTFAEISKKELEKISFTAPDLPTQKRIAKILSTVDGQIEKTDAIIAKYQAIKQGMLRDLFTRGIDLTTGKLRPIPEQAPELYKSSPLGLIPKDWEIYHLRDLLNNVIDNRGKTPPTISNGEIELIETVSISNIELYPDFSKVSKYVTFNTYKNWFRGYIERNDILISTVGEYAGSTALLHKTRGVIGQNLVSLRVNNAYDYFFTYFWTKTPYFSFNLGQVMMSAAQPSLKLPHLLNFKIAIPQIKKESEAIGNSLLHVYNMISSESINLLKLEKLKQGLMSKLLNGDV